MTRAYVSRLLLACALPAVVAAMLVAPGSAGAFVLAPCAGESIEANGATLQKAAQVIWNKEFDVKGEGACVAGPTVKYTGTGSGPGLASWGVGASKGTGKFGPKNAYVGTDEPPNNKQIKEICEEGPLGAGCPEEGKNTQVLTIPVVQESVAPIVHLPAECTVEGGTERLKLGSKELEKIMDGTVFEWAKLTEKGANKLVGAGCKSKIQRVVRKKGSGTTSIWMKFQNLTASKTTKLKFGGGADTEAKEKCPAVVELFWKEEAVQNENVCWPKEATNGVLRGEGGAGVREKVEATAGSIGYSALADARKGKMIPPEGGKGKPFFWVEVENGKVKEEGITKPVWADPSTNGDETAVAKANCAETLYTDGTKKFPPENAEQSWSEVTTSTKEPHYPICGFSYDLSLTHYEKFGAGEAATEGGARTAFDYLNYEVATKGGQEEIGKSTDYEALPENAKGHVLKIAQEGAKKINI
jgi:ABC-type phosphate transport system substrate-binding protein